MHPRSGCRSHYLGRVGEETPVDRQDPSSFWTVGTTAMTESEAVETAEHIARVYPEVHAFALNPRTSMTLALDRWTAEMIRDAVASYVEAGGDAGSMLEWFDEWLARAE